MKFSLVIPLAPDRNAPIIDSIKKLDYSIKDFHVVIVRGTNPSENRNRGASKAKGGFIVFLDDDAIIDKDYLKKAEEFFDQYPEIDIVGGPQLTPDSDKGFAKISGYTLSSKFGAANSSKRYVKGKLNLNADEKLITSANLIVKREVMKKIQFDSKLFPGEDPKFIEDAKRKNLKVAYCSDFIIYHKRRPTIKSFFKQNFNYGKVRPAKENFFQTLKNPQFLIPSLFVIYLVFLLISLSFKLNIMFFIPLIIYGSLNILFSIYESIKNKNINAIFALPWIYFILHISYGIGMIWGYIKKL